MRVRDDMLTLEGGSFYVMGCDYATSKWLYAMADPQDRSHLAKRRNFNIRRDVWIVRMQA